MPMNKRREEAQCLLDLRNQDVLAVLTIIETQLNVVYARSQVLVGLAGAVITVTGFSGKYIAETSSLAQSLAISGLAIVLTATVWVFLRVMGIRWATTGITDDKLGTIERLLERRDQKTTAYAIGGAIMCLGLLTYGSAVALLLAAA